MSRAISREISRAESPSNPGSVKSERITSGLLFRQDAPQHRFGIHAHPVARETTGLELTDGDFRLHRQVFHHDHSYPLHEVLVLRD